MKKDKLITDFYRLLNSQDFKSEKELKKFLDTAMQHEIPSFPKEILSSKEQAQDLIFEAYELSKPEGYKKAKEALRLDPDCIEAYEYLGSVETYVEIAINHYKKGIGIGRKLFGGKYLEEHKGKFWGFHETRPFMRCLQQYADCLYMTGNVKGCVAVLEEMITLNPNDNQGARDFLLLYLIEIKEYEKFEKYTKQFKDDSMAFPLFNNALYAFVREGESKTALTKLKAALKSNKFVATKLISGKKITKLPQIHGFGDENEADFYTHYAQPIWKKTKGALEWLLKNS